MIRPIGGHVQLKPPPKNPRYRRVKATIDSGCNVLKVQDKVDEMKNNVRFRREEYFQRLKPAGLLKLMEEGQVDFLLLDVRDGESFKRYHMKGAVSYPAPTLTRTLNPFSMQILNYVNKDPDKIIIIYDDDERIAVNAGNLFFEKGVDNIHMLSGGEV
ncbi:hypothetical protein CBR_g52621 [Chara braunii]|uniref:Rhodanese domain-containing protein n=1 Tax=Chara braunii TaxID=69332 RepID=A0A388MAP4_CHABU|nr:hypothetical protein CBR_g52621 [Chara braunii]|eukprot:GBG91585.1 hypothetical protein CBR_g52621 [Chara braunii]